MNFSIDKKIFAGFAASVCILMAVGVISFFNSQKLAEDSAWVTHTQKVINQFGKVLNYSVDAETGMRGYVITGNEKFLEPYYLGREKLPDAIDSVRRLTADNGIQQKRIDSLEKAVQQSLLFIERTIQARKSAGMDSAVAVVNMGLGKMATDKIRFYVSNAQSMENSLLTMRNASNRASARNFDMVFMLLITTIILVLVGVYFVIRFNLRALRRAEKQTADKNWILTGSGLLAKEIEGNKSPAELAQIIVTNLSRYLDAQVGALYLAEDNGMDLMLTGAYAIDPAKSEQLRLRMGEGLPGQAAAENRVILVKDIPRNYFNIRSGTGQAEPKQLLLVPFSFEGRVKGVIELGSISGFETLQLEFIEVVCNSLGIAVTSARDREKMKELLEETQRQAEELEAQQEELRQSNEELVEKTQLLEESEEELRAQQEELQQNNAELEEKADLLQSQKGRLENIQVELERKAKELEITSKYKSEFLANMSHELRTPLNSILILSQLLSENKYMGLSSKEIEFAKNIYGSGNDLLNLINEILDLSKIESGKMELDVRNVPFSEVVEDISVMFREVARHKGIDFRLSFNEQAQGAVIRTDQQRLEQVLRNLLSNAFKFTERGGKVALTIGPPPQGFAFRNNKLAQAPGVVCFSVTDTGIGIPSDKLNVIFEAFQQVDGSTKRRFGGTGLGLSISRELAAALGGEIHVLSKEGQGSTFTLLLPLDFSLDYHTPMEKKIEVREAPVQLPETETPVTADQVMDDRESISEKDRSILIIEDDVPFAKVLLDYIRERNYKGLVAHQGNTGLSLARHYRPDAIMLDMKVPVIDGTDVLKLLKSDPALRHIPVQVISLYDRKREMMALGAFSYLQKPVSSSDLQHLLNKVEDFMHRGMKKLLIVEDNELQNSAIRELIGNGDVKCFAAYSGTEAYRMMTRENFDCIILDLGLPDISGFDFLEKIKANEQLSNVPVIVYTGKELEKEERDKLSRLADTVVLKTADSLERLFDETALFLHRVESKLPKEKQLMIRKLHKSDDVLKDKTILVVDDDIRNIYSLVNALENEGVTCLTAENGQLALTELKENPQVDLVLMDVMMPEMDGYEATRQIRSNPGWDKLPVIALTAKAMKGDREKCLAAGMSDYISKPVNTSQLLSLMRVWLYKNERANVG